MAGTVSRKEAEGFWNKYNKNNDDELTVEEVTQAVQEFCEKDDLDSDVKSKYAFFGQEGPRNLKKEEFIEGMLRTKTCDSLRQKFSNMDTDGSGSLSKDELLAGLQEQGFDEKIAGCIVDEVDEDCDKKFNIDEFIDAVAFSEYMAKSFGI